MSEDPGKETVEFLLKKVRDGSYVVPYFQRGFEWTPRMVCDLFESIIQDYYTGLILLWELNRDEAKREKWDPVWGIKLKKNNIPGKAILDGQQRLASLYYAIYNPEEIFPNRQSYYGFFLDLNKVLNGNFEEAIRYYYYLKYRPWDYYRGKLINGGAESGIIPLSILSAKDPNNPRKKYILSKEFDDWVIEYLKRNRHKFPEDLTVHSVYKILENISEYPFVVYTLSNYRELPDICNIFARVNEKGMKLSTFDLMNAFLYSHGVKLRKDLWENLDNEILKNIDISMNEYLLKIISLVKQNYCSSKYIYNLIPGEKTTRKNNEGNIYEEVLIKNGKEFKSFWNKAYKYAEKAREIIMNTGDWEFGAIKTNFIPNSTILPVLAAILWKYRNRLSKQEFKNMMEKWYWSAVLSKDYSGSSDSVMAKDFRDWGSWITDGTTIGRINKMNKKYIYDLNLKEVEKSSARYNAIINLLALNDVKDFYKGRIAGTGDYSNEKINDHHIFPKKVKGLKSKKCKLFSNHKDSILNRTLLLDETNKRIKNKKPSQYIKDMINECGSGNKVKIILEGHFINEKAYKYMKNDNFDDFVIEREKTIKEHIITKLGIS